MLSGGKELASCQSPDLIGVQERMQSRLQQKKEGGEAYELLLSRFCHQRWGQ
jgi:hypothetical protein